MSSDEQRESRWTRWRSPRKLRSHLLWLFGWGVWLYVTTTPWRALWDPPAPAGTRAIIDTAIALVIGVIYVWVLLHGKYFRALSAASTLWLVLGQVIFIEGNFARWYYGVSAVNPGAFDQKLAGIDAAYFTISTATTTGMGDIHPVSGVARSIVTGQMIASLYLVVIALGTAAQRVLASRGTKDDDR